MRKIFFVGCCLLFTVFSCKPKLKPPTPSAGNADLTKFVALGGTYMAGYQDWVLYADGQQHSLPELLSKQFQLVGGGSCNQPLMPDNSGLGLDSKIWENQFFKAAYLNYATDCKGVKSLMPIVNSLPIASAGIYTQHQIGSFQNLSVPYAKISDYQNPSLGNLGNSNPYYARFASNPGISTMLSDAKVQLPTFFALWTGMEDIYDYAANGGYGKTILSSSAFGSSLDSVISQLNTKGVIANIPDIASLPFFTTVPWNGLSLTKNQADSLNLLFPSQFNFTAGNNGFVIEDSHASSGYRKMVRGEFVLLTVPLDSIKCQGLGSITAPIPNRYVLDTAEVNTVRQMIAEYNIVIAAKAQQYNLALADMNSYFQKVVSGIQWNGIVFNAQFVSGGFFSLDGYCPNEIGYSLIANEFIRAINTKYNATIPWVNCIDCNGIKFP